MAGVRASSAAIVQLRDVVKIYNRSQRGLLGANLRVDRGEFVLITGASGAGKSTLLKLLYGEELVDRGAVVVDDSVVSELNRRQLAMLRRKIGIVFQDYKLIPRRTVAENIAFVLLAQGYSQTEIRRRLTPALRLVGLLHKADHFPEQLSGGEQQRASIARAIVSTPPLILADEPTGNLDGDNSQQIISILERLNEFGATTIVTTHDELWVRRSHHRVLQLNEGKLYEVRPASNRVGDRPAPAVWLG